MATIHQVGEVTLGGRIRREALEHTGHVKVGNSDGTGDADVFAVPAYNREKRTTTFHSVTVTVHRGYDGWVPREIACALLSDNMDA